MVPVRLDSPKNQVEQKKIRSFNLRTDFVLQCAALQKQSLYHHVLFRKYYIHTQQHRDISNTCSYCCMRNFFIYNI